MNAYVWTMYMFVGSREKMHMHIWLDNWHNFQMDTLTQRDPRDIDMHMQMCQEHNFVKILRSSF